MTKVVGVVTSSGSRKVAVPALEGRSLEAAMPLLRDSGLFKGRITQIHTPRAAAGKILAQHPPGRGAGRAELGRRAPRQPGRPGGPLSSCPT